MLPFPSSLVEGELAAEQIDQIAADREAEAGSAVLASGGAVSLRERLEDRRLQLLLDPDAGIADGQRDDRAGLAEALVAGLQPPSWRELQRHLAVVGELEGVREQVVEDLAQAVSVGDDRCRAGASSSSTE